MTQSCRLCRHPGPKSLLAMDMKRGLHRTQSFQIHRCTLAVRLLQITRLLLVFPGASVGRMSVTNELLPEDNGTDIDR